MQKEMLRSPVFDAQTQYDLDVILEREKDTQDTLVATLTHVPPTGTRTDFFTLVIKNLDPSALNLSLMDCGINSTCWTSQLELAMQYLVTKHIDIWTIDANVPEVAFSTLLERV